MTLLATLGAGTLVGLTVLLGQAEDRAGESEIETARIVALLTVRRNVTEADFTAVGELSAAGAADLDVDIAALVAEQRLVGLEIWRADGRLLYADRNHPPGDVLSAEERARIEVGTPWVAKHDNGRFVATVDVYLPYDAGVDGVVDGLVKILVPEANISERVSATSRRLYVIAVTLLTASGLGLLTLRRRLVKRSYEASHDRLTCLMNWAGFRDEVTHALAKQQSDTGRTSAVLLIDLDRFKSVNDTLGHPAGDTLLQQVATTIRSSVRPDDIVARLGGDEFAILLSDFSNADHAFAAALQLRNRLLSSSVEVEGVGLRIEASIGVSLVPTHGTDVDVLLRCADVAMYRAKRTGAGVATYDEAADPNDVNELKLLAELRRAIDCNELVLHYQPKAAIANRRVAGVEALVRWRHPTRGLLAPAVFIPLAESTGLLGPLTEWVLAQAIEDAAHWHRGGMSLTVAVNVSPRSFLDGTLTATVGALLATSDLPAQLLEIEVTETAIMTDPAGCSHIMRQLRATGVRISIDDFGSGYTSLVYLKTLPVDALKIDRSLISDLTADDRGLAVTKSIIDLGHRLGLVTVAEGIETDETWRLLHGLGCDEGQGYLLARPMPAEQIEGWITSHRHSRGHSGPNRDASLTNRSDTNAPGQELWTDGRWNAIEGPAVHERREESPPPRPLHTVLYVEDNPANLQLVYRLFARRPDIELITATQGRVGLDLARKYQPTVVLLDLDLPDINGDEVLKALQVDPITHSIPIIILSGNTNYATMQRLLESGAVAYLTKPIDVHQLLDTIDQHIRERTPAPKT